jgi:hypothetical protein
MSSLPPELAAALQAQYAPQAPAPMTPAELPMAAPAPANVADSMAVMQPAPIAIPDAVAPADVVSSAMPTMQQFDNNAIESQQLLDAFKAKHAAEGTGSFIGGNADTRAKQDLADLQQLQSADPKTLNSFQQKHLSDLQAALASQAPTAPMADDAMTVTSGQSVPPEVQVALDADKAKETAVIEKKEQRAAIQQMAAKKAIQQATEADEYENLLKEQKQLAQTDKNVADGQARGAMNLADIYSKGSWGQRIGATLALMAGGVSQGLLKLGSNPALDTINKMVEQEGERRKLDMQQKKELREAALADVKFKLDVLGQKSQSAVQKAQIEKMKADVENDRAKLNADSTQSAALQAAIQQGRNGELNDVVGLPQAIAETAVRLPNGKYSLAKNKPAAEALDKYVNEVNPALDAIDRIQELSRNYGLLSKVKGAVGLDERRRKIETELIGLVGNLRLPFTGPGQLLEKEYERLRGAIGNPAKILAFEDREKAAMEQVRSKLVNDRKGQYFRAGVNLPSTRMEQLEEALVAKGVPKEQVKEAIRRKFGN